VVRPQSGASLWDAIDPLVSGGLEKKGSGVFLFVTLRNRGTPSAVSRYALSAIIGQKEVFGEPVAVRPEVTDQASGVIYLDRVFRPIYLGAAQK